MSKKYYIVVYGCQMNVSDSERVAAIFESMGYKKTSKMEGADLVAIVMCSVRQAAVDRVFGLAEKFKEMKRKPKTILTGCILKKDRKTFSEIFDYVVDIKDILERGNKLFAGLGLLVSAETKRGYQQPEKSLLPSEKTRSYVPISNGCNNFCTYCVVPYTRGKLVCRDHREILEEIKKLARPAPAKGFGEAKELWLLGQNVNDYSSPTDPSIKFPELLKLVNNLPGNFKIFFMSPNPKNFSDKLIKTMAQSKKFSRYLNLPIQSGDNEILKKMNRSYTAQKYIALVKKIRKAIPNINLSTDVIVGFPGETKKQFENTEKLFKKIKFNIAYINKYSPRWGTAAAKLKDNVLWKEKKRREKILMDIINEQ